MITGPLHPSVPGLVAGLQTAAAEVGAPSWTVLGVVADRSGQAGIVPPPGVTELLVIPRDEDDEWVSRVVSVAMDRRIDAVLPWTERDLWLLAPRATEFAELGVALVCPPAPLVEVTHDRWVIACRLSELAVPTPESRAVDRASDLGRAARALGYPERQLGLLPRRPDGPWGVWSVRDNAGLGSTGSVPALPLYALMAAASTCPDPLELVLQQRMPGIDVQVDVLAQDGKVLASVERTRGPAAVARGGNCAQGADDARGTVRPTRPAIAELVELLVAALHWSQLLTVDVVWDPLTGRAVVSGVTAGASRSIGAAAYVGVPLLSAAVELAMTGTPPRLPAPAAGSVMYRPYATDQVWPV